MANTIYLSDGSTETLFSTQKEYVCETVARIIRERLGNDMETIFRHYAEKDPCSECENYCDPSECDDLEEKDSEIAKLRDEIEELQGRIAQLSNDLEERPAQEDYDGLLKRLRKYEPEGENE